MTRLYVGNGPKTDNVELRELFQECGKLKHFDVKDGSGYIVKLKTNNNFLFKEFETQEEAQECVNKYHK